MPTVITPANDLTVRRLPPFSALRAVEAAARHRSYSAAARELAVTQGAISQQIRKLEAELGIHLFHRRGNEMNPTAEAERLAREVAAATDRLRATIDEMTAEAEQGPLVISVMTNFAGRWLGPKLERLLAHTAGANLDVREEVRIANFRTDGVDIGVRVGRGDWQGLEMQRLTTERLCVVCSPEFQRRHRIRSVRDLLTIPLVDSHERLWPLLFDRHGLPAPPPGQLAANGTMLTLGAVARDLGAALVRYSMVHEDLKAGRLVRPVPDLIPLPLNFVDPGQLVRLVREGDPMPPELGYFIVWRAENRKQRRIRALCDWLVAEARAAEDVEAYLAGTQDAAE